MVDVRPQRGVLHVDQLAQRNHAAVGAAQPDVFEPLLRGALGPVEFHHGGNGFARVGHVQQPGLRAGSGQRQRLRHFRHRNAVQSGLGLVHMHTSCGCGSCMYQSVSTTPGVCWKICFTCRATSICPSRLGP